jgi:hypothetical protein
MVAETQTHRLTDGSIDITRNGRHQYRIEDGDWVPSVTTMLGHLDAGAFGIGMNWALKIAREQDDFEAPRRISKDAQEEGTRLHLAIQEYIDSGTVDEDNPLFTSWLSHMGGRVWVATERFCLNSKLGYGGTIDAISMGQDGELEIWDWKTKDATSFSKYGGSIKDHAQLGAYASALHEMGSQLAPVRGYVAYIMRDGSGVHIDEVDLGKGYTLFLASRNVYNLIRAG